MLNSVFDFLGTVSPAMIDAVMDGGSVEEWATVAAVLPQMSNAQRERLLGEHSPAIMAMIASSVDVAALTVDETRRFTYSPAVEVRAAFAARSDVPTEDRITAMIGRLPPTSSEPVPAKYPAFHHNAGLPIRLDKVPTVTSFANLIPSLSTAQMDRLSTTALPTVMEAVAYYATTSRQLGNLAAGLYEYAYNLDAAPYRSSISKRMAALRSAAHELRNAISRFPVGSGSEIGKALVDLRDALAAFANPMFDRMRLKKRLSPEFEKPFFDALATLVATECFVDTTASTFERMTIRGISTWIRQYGSRSPIPSAAVDPLLECALRRLPADTIEELVHALPTERIIDALATLDPLNLRPRRDDLPTLFTLDEVAHVISVPQMFFFPLDQIYEYLDAAGLRPADVLSLDLAVPCLTPTAVSAIET